MAGYFSAIYYLYDYAYHNQESSTSVLERQAAHIQDEWKLKQLIVVYQVEHNTQYNPR